MDSPRNIRKFGYALCIVGWIGLLFTAGFLQSGIFELREFGKSYLLLDYLSAFLLASLTTALGLLILTGLADRLATFRRAVACIGMAFWGALSVLFVAAHFLHFEYSFYLWFDWWPPHWFFTYPLIVGVYQPGDTLNLTDLAALAPFSAALWTALARKSRLVDWLMISVLTFFLLLIGVSTINGVMLEIEYWTSLSQLQLLDPPYRPAIRVYAVYVTVASLMLANIYVLFRRTTR